MRSPWVIGVWLCLMAGTVMAADPFRVDASLVQRGTQSLIEVSFGIPRGHHIYADTVSVALGEGDRAAAPVEMPTPARYHDAFSPEPRDSYTNDFKGYFAADGGSASGLVVKVRYQGCSETLCFFPATRTFDLRREATDGQGRSAAVPAAKDDTRPDSAELEVVGRAAGYLGVDEFLAFLDTSEGKTEPVARSRGLWDRMRNAYRLFCAEPVEYFAQFGVGWTLLAVLIGGLLLNLTPCVLPMIPVNLAIIGAGSQGTSRGRGFALGGVYGIGMALVYGLLGLVVILTGAPFGALNSKPWFNAAMALLFVALGMAMFDVITIDFTRFQRGGAGIAPKRSGVGTALTMGGVAALLAGACVAPVVIAVLALSGSLFASGARTVGVALPFVLGFGMALPWPFAGGGLALLPKPGAWMARVKYGFGAVILLFALYYGSLAYDGWTGRSAKHEPVPGMRQASPAEPAAWTAALAESRQTGKPVFVDFWATWCKTCKAMEATTFRTEPVRLRLDGYIAVQFQAENPDDPVTKAYLDRYGVKGLPTYVILAPGRGRGPARE